MTGAFCPWCGSKTQPGFSFCRSCGRGLPPAQAAPEGVTAPLAAITGNFETTPGAGGQGIPQVSRVAATPATGRPSRPLRFPHRPKLANTLAVIGVIAVALILVVLAIYWAENPQAESKTTTPPSAPSGANPYGMSIDSVTGGVIYAGTQAGYFGSFQGASLCTQCPEKVSNGTSMSPDGSITIYFNISNVGSAYHFIDGYNLTTNSAGSFQFEFFGPSCYVPTLDPQFPWHACSGGLGIDPGTTQEVMLTIWSGSIPSIAGGGYSLSFLISTDS